MLTKTLYNLHIYIIANYGKNSSLLCFSYDCRFSNALLGHVSNVLITVSVENSVFECCFWSTQCFERQARTFGKVKTWVFRSLNMQRWSLLDNVVLCYILGATKAAFLEVEKTILTVLTLVPRSTIITHGLYTSSKQ